MNIKGSLETVKKELKDLVDVYNPVELIAVTSISEKEDIVKAYDILAQAAEEI